MTEPAQESLTYQEWEYIAVLIAHDVTTDIARGLNITANRHSATLLKVTNTMAQMELASD